MDAMTRKFIPYLIRFVLITLTFAYGQNAIPLPADQRALTAAIPVPDKSTYLGKLSSELNTLYQKYSNRQPFKAFAGQSGLQIENNAVEAMIFLESNFQPGQSYLERLQQFGIYIKAASRHALSVQIPIPLLAAIDNRFAGIVQIRRPLTPKETAVTSEGVVLMNADAWHSAGHEGTGVKVAVIDGGFNQLTDAQDAGDIPSSYSSQDFTGTGLETGSSHGTAVAEAIYDIAPLAELYLYKIADYTDFENAKDYCITNGIDIVNHSMGWFNAGGYYDGTGYVCTVASDAIANDILWVNSAGNSALDHYRALFDPYTGDASTHNFGEGNINYLGPEPGYVYPHAVGQAVNVTMNWDDYPITDQDYDLYLYRWTGSTWTFVTASTTRQTGSSPPEEHIYHVNNIANAYYGLVVVKYSATENVDLTLFSLEYGFAYHTTSSSITDPASVTGVVAVGAIDRNYYDAGPQEDFSSQGPTTDGRLKPDIMSPDNCISFAYGYWFGTSLSSPHTAGICAVIKSSSPGYSNDQIKNYLYHDAAIDLGDVGKDNIYGWGKIGLSDSPLPVMLTQFTASSHDNGILIEWTTASEVNNACWVIEKQDQSNLINASSGKGSNIPEGDEGYKEMATIDGSGNADYFNHYHYMDSEVTPSGYYRYRLSDVSYNGSKTYHDPVVVQYQPPAAFSLDQNYPNPFNPTTVIRYSIPVTNHIDLSIFNLLGQKVATLVSEKQRTGRYQVEFNGSDLPDGVYFYRLQAGNFRQIKKLVLLQ
jgi:hypothetical protein